MDYEKPHIEIVDFIFEDVITTSGCNIDVCTKAVGCQTFLCSEELDLNAERSIKLFYAESL